MGNHPIGCTVSLQKPWRTGGKTIFSPKFLSLSKAKWILKDANFEETVVSSYVTRFLQILAMEWLQISLSVYTLTRTCKLCTSYYSDLLGNMYSP